MNAYVTGIGTFLPNDPVPNDKIESILGMVDGKPSRTRTRVLKSNGIVTRHYAVDPATGQATHSNAQLAAEAVRRVIGATRFDLKTLSLLACGTSSPDQILPGHASMVHGELASPPCEIVSNAGGCCTSISALKYAALAVAGGEAPNAMVTGSELLSPLMRGRHFEPEIEERVKALEEKPYLAFEHDFLRWMLSDGAGAVLVEPQPRRDADMPSARIEWIENVSYGGQMEVCMYHGGRKNGSVLESWKHLDDAHEWIRRGVFNMGQDARLLSENITRICADALKGVLKKHPLKGEEVAWFVPHNSSAFFNGEVAKGLAEVGLNIPTDRYFTNLTRKGNVGAASMFISLDELLHSDRVRSGQKILCLIPESARFSVAYMLLTVN